MSGGSFSRGKGAEAPDSASKLGAGSEARGRLSGSGIIELHGYLVGEVDWAGPLLVGSEAKLEASGRIKRVEVLGVIHGHLEVEEEALVRQGACWSGGCSTPIMATEAGSWLDGVFSVRPEMETGS